MTDTKPIPKSLHTVRVLVVFAREYLSSHDGEAVPYSSAVDVALFRLGYENTPDTHGLRAAALKQIGA